MLTLKNIVKDYDSGDQKVRALDGVSLQFRENEFVSILGPSGCGKTTLLNIIGGLDQYTSGDLVINGVSTKKYKDSDWDTYRNHSIGFVFQSYNLIPHQTVLANVELALTLSGISPKERRERAIEALRAVGLESQMKKKPNQMSGGQMQRVAIARALVNNPDILLADEPTGALDTQTSVQIMDILRNIAKEKLIIMVTHNPELATEYSNRIIRLVDGHVVDDSNPYEEEPETVTEVLNDEAPIANPTTVEEVKAAEAEAETAVAEVPEELPTKGTEQKKGKKRYNTSKSKQSKKPSHPKHSESAKKSKAVKECKKIAAPKVTEKPKKIKKEKPPKAPKVKREKNKSMSFLTALSLSLNNLMTKKARTFMTSFAGSIGIIGIALILSVSTGVNNYIAAVQRDTLSTYPLSIYKETQDYTAMLGAMTQVSESASGEVDDSKIYVDDSLGTMMSAMSATVQNNLEKFKQYVDAHYDGDLAQYVSDIQYAYDYKLQVYTADGKTQVSPTTLFDNMGEAFAGMDQLMEMGGGFSVMSEMINNQALLDEQYELVGEGSHWPQNANEVVLVVSQNNRISKMTLYMLGVLSQEGLDKVVEGLMTGNYDTTPMEPYNLTDFLGMEFMMLNTSDFFEIDTSKSKYKIDGSDVEYPVWRDTRLLMTDEAMASFVTQNGTKLVISGIVRPKAGASASSISTPLAYTKQLTDLILAKNAASAVINQQKATPDRNVLTGLTFERTHYTRENIDELISKVDDATMEKLYAWMTQEILGKPENAEKLVVNSKESFLGFFMLMPNEMQQNLVKQMLDIAKQSDPEGNNLKGIFTALTMMLKQSGTNDISVTANNFLFLMPQLSAEQVLLFLNGVPAGEQTLPNGMTVPTPAIDGLIDACGETAMSAIYADMTAKLPTLTINEEMFTMLMQGNFIDDAQFAQMEDMLYKLATNTDATYKSVLSTLGDAEAAKPAAVHFYAKDFESKDAIEDFIKNYNDSVEEVDQLKYSDIVKTLMSSITTIINAISYVLIAFVAISLVVSSIMIGIITYISVLERTKEIGILRSIGASKRDIRRVFNAETLIVGFVAGAIGILATLGLNVIINIILFHYTGLASLKAVLPVEGAIVLVLISMFLTFIAGLFPSSIAAKRNPVEALRSE